MDSHWHLEERLAKSQHAELIQEAERERLGRLAQVASRRESVLSRLFNWLHQRASAVIARVWLSLTGWVGAQH
jgi:hypothetical protein